MRLRTTTDNWTAKVSDSILGLIRVVFVEVDEIATIRIKEHSIRSKVWCWVLVWDAIGPSFVLETSRSKVK